jgi:hypothetical protein
MNFETYLNLVFPNGLNINEALNMIVNVGIYIGGIGVYAVFIFHFYRFLSSRDMFKFDLSGHQESRHKAVRGILQFLMYVAKYIVVFPFFAFFWLAVLTLILAFLSKDRTFADVLLIALATVSAIRVAAYYNEDLSRDLAKILPFAVLGIFIIDASFFTFNDSLAMLQEANNQREAIFYYFVFLVGLEFVLRLIWGYFMGAIAWRRRVLAQPGEEQDAEAILEDESAEEVGEAEELQESEETEGAEVGPIVSPAAAPAD